MSNTFIENLITYINHYIIIENNLRVFPLVSGDIADIINYSDSHHIQMRLFKEVIEVRKSEMLENHKTLKKIINMEHINLTEEDMVLRNHIVNIINKYNTK